MLGAQCSDVTVGIKDEDHNGEDNIAQFYCSLLETSNTTDASTVMEAFRGMMENTVCEITHL